ncbi:hypothetical protein M5D96_011456 [Drosophila gunungcola]|uniref:Uncharacterized protein n=1 Tax=Drosophila gunungcola TaxID=103775 RepID=A0A9Q0BKY4_9MUSC|nr:hypothetical protein M5D96_011456 [Drosophila gunungcola]
MMDDLMRALDWMNVETTLQHAALASEACTGRTLGADREPLWVEGRKSSPVANAIPEDLPVPKEEIPLVPRTNWEPSISCFPDAQAINASIVKRELEEEGKRCVRQQLKVLKDRQDARRLSRESQQKQEESQLQQKALRERNEILLNQKADQMTKVQLEAQQREQLALRQQTDQSCTSLPWRACPAAKGDSTRSTRASLGYCSPWTRKRSRCAPPRTHSLRSWARNSNSS